MKAPKSDVLAMPEKLLNHHRRLPCDRDWLFPANVPGEIVRPDVTLSEYRRARSWFNGQESQIREAWRLAKRGHIADADALHSSALRVAAMQGMQVFLARFPLAELLDRHTSGFPLANQGSPKFAERYSNGWDRFKLTVLDHVIYWRSPSRLRFATSFPYHTRTEWASDLEPMGLEIEIEPPDLPNLYGIGGTVPCVLFQAGTDWRTAAGYTR